MQARIRGLAVTLAALAGAAAGAEEGATNGPAADAPVPAVAPAAPTVAPEAPAAALRTNAWWRWLGDRILLGARVSYYGLAENTKRQYDAGGTFTGGYLGSIDRLEEEQNYVPVPVLGVYPVRWLGVELSWERLRLKTLTYYDDHSDGTFDLAGPSVMLAGRWLNASRFAPYAGAGVVFFGADFEMYGPWHYGFNSDAAYDAWRADGAPPWPNAGYERNIECDDSATAFLVQAGCQVRCTRHLRAELGARYVWLDLDAHYWLSFYGVPFEDHGTYNFPMDYWAGYAGLFLSF